MKDIIFDTMTDEELLSIVKEISRIQATRREARRKELIDNFHQAWAALRDDVIDITYGEYKSEAVELSDWDFFDFD